MNKIIEPEKISLARLLVEFPPRSGHNRCNGKGFYLAEYTHFITPEGKKIPSRHRKIEVCSCVGNKVVRAGKIYDIDVKGDSDAV